MADDILLSKKLEHNAVVAAIEAIKRRAAEVTPSSLADALNVEVKDVLEDAEVMDLISGARKEANGVGADYERLVAKVKELEDSNAKLQQIAAGFSYGDGQDELRLLQARVDEEIARNRRLEEESRLMKNRNDALVSEISTLRKATVEILRPSDEIDSLFTNSRPTDINQIELLSSRCQELEVRLAKAEQSAGIQDELNRLRQENAELNDFKRTALSVEEQEALSQHLASMTSRQAELYTVVEHLQKENTRLMEGGGVSVDHQTKTKPESELYQQLNVRHEELSEQHRAITEQLEQLKELHQKLNDEHEELKYKMLEVQESQHTKTPNESSNNEVDSLVQQITEVTSKHDELNNSHAALYSQYNELCGKHAQLTEQHSELAAAHADLSGKHDDLSRTHEDLCTKHNDLSEQHNNLAARANEQGELRTEHEELRAKHQDLEERFSAREQEITDLSSQNEELQRRQEELKARQDDLISSNQEQASAKLIELQSEHDDLIARQKLLSETIEELTATNEQRLALVEEFKSRNEELNSQLQDNQSRNAELQLEVEGLKAAHSELYSAHEKLQQRCEELNREHQALLAQSEQQSSRDSELAARHEALDAQHKDLTTLYLDLNEQNKEVNSKYQELNKQFGELSASHKELSEQHKEDTDRSNQLRAKYKELNGKFQDLTVQHQDLELNYNELKTNTAGGASADLAAQHQQLLADYQVLNGRLQSMEKDRTKLTEQVTALESANQLIAASIQDAWQQGYQSAKLDFARENFVQVANAAAEATGTIFTSDGVHDEAMLDDFHNMQEYLTPGLFEEHHENESEAPAPTYVHHPVTGEHKVYTPPPQPDYLDWQTSDETTAGHEVQSVPIPPPLDHVNTNYPGQGASEVEQPAANYDQADAGYHYDQSESHYYDGAEDQAHYSDQHYGNQQSNASSPYTPPPLPQDDWHSGAESAPYNPYASHDHLDYQQHSENSEYHPQQQGQGFTADELHNLVQHRVETREESTKEKGLKKFVGGGRNTQEAALPSLPRNVPPDIRKACLLLGLKPEELTRQAVFNAWKREMVNVHPDTGGDTEMATYLNTAKDRLVRYLEETAPKLGKKFGSKDHPPTGKK